MSFAAAYGRERVPAYLFLPKNASPPYQTVVLFPSAYALNAGSSNKLDLTRFDFIVRSGRALLYPVYQGTFERRLTETGLPTPGATCRCSRPRTSSAPSTTWRLVPRST